MGCMSHICSYSQCGWSIVNLQLSSILSWDGSLCGSLLSAGSRNSSACSENTYSTVQLRFNQFILVKNPAMFTPPPPPPLQPHSQARYCDLGIRLPPFNNLVDLSPTKTGSEFSLTWHRSVFVHFRQRYLWERSKYRWH